MTDSAHSSPPTRVQVPVKVLLGRLWRAVVQYKGIVAAVLGLAFLEAVFTKAPLALVQPLMAALTGESSGIAVPGMPGDWDFNTWFQGVADSLVATLGIEFGSPAMNVVFACGFFSVICGILGAAAIYGVAVLSRYFATVIVVDLRNEVAGHILNLPLRFFGVRRMGELMSNITNDTQALSRSFSLAFDHVAVDPLLILGNFAVLAWLMPQAIWILLLMVPLMAIPMYRMGRRVRKTSSRSLQAMGDATESMNQMLTGIRTVKAFQLERERLEDFKSNNARFLKRTLRMFQAKALSQSLLFVGYQLGSAALLTMLGWLVLVEQSLDVATVAAAIAPLGTTYTHVKRLTRAYGTLMESAGALEGIEAVLRERPEPGGGGGLPVPEVRGAVEMQDVHFSYGGDPVLRGINLQVDPGQTVALVGPSGGGKSTTLDLLARFYDPSSGRILIDGRDLRELDVKQYRRHIAVVSQQPFLFNVSIRDNIRYGRPEAGQAEVEEAARAAQIHDFIVSLPEGYDTLAGERGCNLSGGQMQRITIARAILRDPAILFLDEATSALDSESEELVQKALDRLRQGRTSFVIAHRLSTITGADRIVVLDEGRIVEEGTHDELMARGGAYRRMRDLQMA